MSRNSLKRYLGTIQLAQEMASSGMYCFLVHELVDTEITGMLR